MLLTGSDDGGGCLGLQDPLKCDVNGHFLPDELHEIITKEEFFDFVRQVILSVNCVWMCTVNNVGLIIVGYGSRQHNTTVPFQSSYYSSQSIEWCCGSIQ